jgi:hypothetical protein
MKTTDMRAKARAIFGSAIAEPMPNQPNGAKALQQRANARPIPTYKVGGPVKKPMPTPADLAAAKAQNEMIKKATVSKEDAARFATGNRNSRLTGEEMKKMKMAMGGKVQTSSDTARKLATEMGGYKKGGKVKPVELDMKMLEEMSRPRAPLPNLESKVAEARNLNTVRAKETSDAAKKQSFKEAFNEARRDQGANGVFTWRGNTYNTKMAGETSKAGRAAAPAPAPIRAAAAAPPAAAPAPRGNPPAAATETPAATPTRGASSAPAGSNRAAAPAGTARAAAKGSDAGSNSGLGSAINRGVGAIQDQMSTQARNMAKNREENPDIFTRIANALSERRKAKADSKAAKDAARRDYDAKAGKAGIGVMLERPPRSVNYAKGGKVKEAKPKDGLAVMIAIGKPMKPAKKMNGGAMAAGSKDMEASKVTRAMAMGGDPMGYMGGGSPMGYAAGGAGKTRKGQAPIKKAQGGAAKVRKGMMTPEGNIIDVMNKMRGK